MTRALAFSCFVCAAFAWSGPWLDRPGIAALGLAFLAWSVGRGFGLRRRVAPATVPPGLLPFLEPEAELSEDTRERLATY